MTNEELTMRIKAGETELMPELWAQVEKFVYMQADNFYNTYRARCENFCVELNDLTQEAFFAIQVAVEKYEPARGTMFLTLAGYYLKKYFFTLLKMNYKNWQANMVRACNQHLEDVLCEEGLTLADTLAGSANTEREVVDKIYTEKLSQDLREALDEMGNNNWRRAIEGTVFANVRPAEYARQIGVSRPTVQRFRRRAFETLRENPIIQAYAVC